MIARIFSLILVLSLDFLKLPHPGLAPALEIKLISLSLYSLSLSLFVSLFSLFLAR
jgi:hypothetical protein